MLSKTAFRQFQLTRLKQAQTETAAVGPQLATALMNTTAWRQAKSVALTVSSPLEVPTEGLIQAAKAAGKIVLLPKTMPHRQMVFLPDPGPNARITSKFGIPEPPFDEASVDPAPALVVVPGIAFALSQKARVGFGAGYYDRFLANYHGPTIALVPPVMQFAVADWPIEDFDVRIDLLLTVKSNQ